MVNMMVVGMVVGGSGSDDSSCSGGECDGYSGRNAGVVVIVVVLVILIKAIGN